MRLAARCEAETSNGRCSFGWHRLVTVELAIPVSREKTVPDREIKVCGRHKKMLDAGKSVLLAPNGDRWRDVESGDRLRAQLETFRAEKGDSK